jgi:xanthine/CO dehydrogenase XdhC/CoxF family maturation factor
MLLYPQVPYRGPYPLEPIHARMRASAGRHTLVIPPSSWRVQSGALEEDASAPWKQALRVAGVNGPAIETSEYLMESGEVDAEVTVSVAEGGAGTVRVATLDVVDPSSGEVLSSEAIVAVRNAAGYQSIPVRLQLPGDQARTVRFRVTPAAAASWKLAGLGFAVDYGFEVIDLAEPLNQFNTHVSVFDAHPNEAAHQAIAEHVYRALTKDVRQP